jgi:hypothetical protein
MEYLLLMITNSCQWQAIEQAVRDVKEVMSSSLEQRGSTFLNLFNYIVYKTGGGFLNDYQKA